MLFDPNYILNFQLIHNGFNLTLNSQDWYLSNSIILHDQFGFILYTGFCF